MSSKQCGSQWKKSLVLLFSHQVARRRALYEEVNIVEYGLTGAVFTSNMTTAQKVIRRIQASPVWVNTVGTHILAMPFGVTNSLVQAEMIVSTI